MNAIIKLKVTMLIIVAVSFANGYEYRSYGKSAAGGNGFN